MSTHRYAYIVPLQPNPSRLELKMAWWFTVISRANGCCQHCGKQTRLSGCHIQSRKTRPDLEFDPDNGMALCRSCHVKFDHAYQERPNGRAPGFNHSAATIEKMKASAVRRAADPAERERRSRATLAYWERTGRKHTQTACERCGGALTQRQRSHGARFCSPACHYAFRTGKHRSGY